MGTIKKATAEEIQDAFRIAVILSGGDRKSFILWFRTELDLIVGQRGKVLDQPLRGSEDDGNSTM